MTIGKLRAAFEAAGVGGLEPLRDTIAPSAGWVGDLVAAVEDPRVAVPASWLLRAYLQAGLELDRARTADLCRRLERVVEDDARLHLCQLVQHLDVPSRNADQLARFLRAGAAGEHKFTRAWAVDGFLRLARQHARHLPEARRLLARAERDAAASVRARARRLRAEGLVE